MALPPKVVDAFERLAAQQRNKPERAMERVSAVHGGILIPVVMHTGDMIHRMTQQAGRGYAGYNEMREKVGRVLDYLKHGMFGLSFIDMHNQNINNNLATSGISEHEYRDRLSAKLYEFGGEHVKLPVYNYVQYLARTAAIAVGNQDFDRLESVLENLWRRLSSEERWTAEAFKYELDQYGNPIAQ
jgi:hypothetical protein